MSAQVRFAVSTPSLFLRSLLFSLGMITSLTLIAPLIVVGFFLPFVRRYQLSQMWAGFNIWWLRVTCGITYQVTGAEHIPNRPVIVMAKHQSTWETLFFNWYLPPMAWVVKRELLWVPLFGWALALLRPIAINRKLGSAAVKQVIRQGMAHLRRGQWVLIFPEGTRTAPGVRKRYGLGGAVLATHSGFPVLPIAHNAGEFWSRRGFFKRPGTVHVVFGPLLESAGRSPQALNQQVEDWIESNMAAISAVPITSVVTDK
ncbi:MAG: 1-acyl-sn-glycerol-3-phosphate acyltransferase [Candidatus Competibacteraceae bacterium]|nr:1-acyl-sn-glycerol-3-phosphate acyltransferase [Candidatus Competibacteraceae bacterium]